MAKISAYNFYCNDVNGKFGTDKTATGVAISPNEYTVAKPLAEGRSPYKYGDVVVITNDKTGNSAIYLVTDCGGLPHADIDISAGVGTDALGVNVTEVKEGTMKGGVAAVSQKDGFSVKRIGAIDIKDKDAVAQFQETSKKINGKPGSTEEQAQLAELDKVKSFNRDGSEKDNQELWASQVKSAREKIKKYDELTSPNGYVDDRPRNPDGSYKDKARGSEDDFLGHIMGMMGDDPMMALFMLVICMMGGFFGEKNMGGIFEFLKDPSKGLNVGGQQYNVSPETQDYIRGAKLSAPENWGKVTPSAQKTVEEGKADAVYQEHRGNGFMSYGTFTIKDKDGNIHSFPAVTGGGGKGSLVGTPDGTNAVDKRYGTVIPEATISNRRNRSAAEDPGMVAGGAAFSYDIRFGGKDENVGGTDRGLFRIHADGGGPGSIGCLVFKPEDAKKIDKILQERGETMRFSILPSLDTTNPYQSKAAEQRRIDGLDAAPAVANNPSQPAAPSSPSSTAQPAAANASLPTPTTNRQEAIAQIESARATAKKLDSSTSNIDYSKVPDRAFEARNEVLAKTYEIKSQYPAGTRFVVIDDGHGTGCGCGACIKGVKEEDVIADFTPKLKTELAKEGIVAINTQDLLPDNWGQGSEAGKIERGTRKEVAAALNAEAFLSIHADAGKSTERGATTYYFGDSGLAQTVSKHMGGNGAKSDLVTQHQELGVLRAHCEIPSTLVELVNLNNNSDYKLVTSDDEWERYTSEKAAQCARAVKEFSEARLVQSKEKAEEKKVTAVESPETEKLKALAEAYGLKGKVLEARKDEAKEKQTAQELIASAGIDKEVKGQTAKPTEVKPEKTAAVATGQALA